MRVGLEIGDGVSAAAVDAHGRVVATAALASGCDVERDVAAAVGALVGPDLAASAIGEVMLATPFATEAAHERTALARVAVVRVGTPSTAIPPLGTWPAPLRAAVSAGEAVVAGGRELDGTPSVALDLAAARGFLLACGSVDAVAVSGVFSLVEPADELRVAELARELLGAVPVSLSHQLGALGLLARENVTVLNAALTSVVSDVTDALRAGLATVGVAARTHLVQGDGTLMTAEYARHHPALTIGGPVASGVRGAGVLSGLDGALVCDAGAGETTIARLTGGAPEADSGALTVEGVVTNLRTPEVADAHGTLAEQIDSMKQSSADERLIVVGPHGPLVPGELPGVSEVVRPRHSAFARAVGAATAPVGATAECVFARTADPATRRAAASAAATDRAVLAGADPGTVVVQEYEEVPFSYLPNLALSVRVSTVGRPLR
ncbi:hydantoinase/oxoprolinase N-terminal domain-containing protein [Conexibacter woesei]|uniref:Hydantoinaseoxoprolinase domain protein n=1 Tax=Conexibacter woesei (strain DSM 14684 / CCUG 47730 / CIP 108061 / JCM 11494 / NBRC 100937 / ID131577) TaxID=469383 RepID=D3F5G4_CONWI|nr:hydantoinase/oxoprolinase N-terminal domain-containing protein [Conexibacter woesei]ADB50631.1 Hydantoinaseoxoprolinase domain protein [Conexibacter woesei DSM 14684]